MGLLAMGIFVLVIILTSAQGLANSDAAKSNNGATAYTMTCTQTEKNKSICSVTE